MLKICVAAAVSSCFTLKYCETASDKDLRKDVMIKKKKRRFKVRHEQSSTLTSSLRGRV